MEDPYRRNTDPDSPNLFPGRRIGRFYMSVQGSRNGHACSPRADLDDIRDYETVEVVLSDERGLLEVQRAGFPPEVRRLFPASGGSTATRVPQEGVALIEAHLRKLAAAPAPGRGPSGGERRAVALTDAGLREILLKLEEAIVAETGEENGDFVEAVSDLVEAARERGLDFDGLERVSELCPDSGPRP